MISGIAELAPGTGVTRDAGGAGVCAGAVDAGRVDLRTFGAGVGIGIGGVIPGQTASAGIGGVSCGAADADGGSLALQTMIADDVARLAFARVRIESHVAVGTVGIDVAHRAGVA